jgi:hypothetical protein
MRFGLLFNRRMTMPQPKATKAPEIANEYEIIDPKVKPDTAGQLGGQRVYNKGGEQRFVKMTARQAEWYLAHGAIKPAPLPGQEGQQ